MTRLARFLTGFIALVSLHNAGSSLPAGRTPVATNDTTPPAVSSRALAGVALAFEPAAAPPGTAATYLARGDGYALSVRPDGARFALTSDGGSGEMRMRIVGASGAADLTPEAPTGGVSNYLIGNDPSRYRTNVPHFARVRARDVYRGIDVVYYGNQRRLEYDFIVAPGADPGRIKLAFSGPDGISISPQGDLILKMDGREIRQTKPHVYQGSNRASLDARFTLDGDGTVGFNVAAWDRTQPLVIDPVIAFGTYFGGSLADTARGIILDSSGNMYVTGTTSSTDFHAVGAIQGALAGGTDAFVMKIGAVGTTIIYSTYLGGTDNDEGRGIGLDQSNFAYVTGQSGGGSFPHSGALSTSCASTDGFVSKLSQTGDALLYSICFGGAGSDSGNGIAVDGVGRAHVTGLANGGNVFVGSLAADATSWIYSFELTGSSTEEGLAIASDLLGNVCVTGRTFSTNLPVTVGVPQPAMAGGAIQSPFVAKYNSLGTPTFVTYLGGSGFDTATGAAIDMNGRCYITGVTNSTNFPTFNAAQNANAGGSEAFVTAYASNGLTYIYSTYIGGSGGDSGAAISVTGPGVVSIAGSTSSYDLPVVNRVQTELRDTGTVSRSINAGAQFARTTLRGRSIQALAIDPANAQVMYAGTTGGVYKTSNGGLSWARVDSGLTYTNVKALAIDPNDPCAIYAGIDTGITNGFTPPSTIVVNNTNGVLAFSPNCGGVWGISIAAPSAREIRSLSFSSGNPATLYAAVIVNAASGGVSVTQHRAYRYVSGAGSFQFTFEDFNYVVAADPADSCRAYLGGFSGIIKEQAGCGALAFVQVGATLTGGVNAIAPHPTISGALLAGTTAGQIFRKPDSGSPWASVATTQGAVTAIAYQPGNATVAYAATIAGVIYKSIDGGGTWTVASTLGPAVLSMAVSPAAPQFIATGTRNDSDVLYARLNAAGAILDLSWVGGYGTDTATGIVIDPANAANIVGTTQSTTFPVTAGVIGPSANAGGSSFAIRLDPNQPARGPQMMQNGSFSSGFAGWSLFATDGTQPDNNYVSTLVTAAQLEFHRVAAPGGAANSAVVLQNTGIPVASGEPILATFEIGNSSPGTKRISVLIHDQDFSDLSVCTFWVPGASPLRPYQMITHTNEAWQGATISFYAATVGGDGGGYLLDNVSLRTAAAESQSVTTCVDPLAPSAPGGGDGPTLLANGDFATGDVSGWSVFQPLTQQVAGGVFEFLRPPPGEPAGAMLQPTSQAASTNEIFTAQFDLGNSSPVRKRVTVLLHDLNFIDLTACTFWLEPGQPLSPYSMRGWATKPWPNVTLSFYAATVGNETWTRLDNVTLKRTPGLPTPGTICQDPGGK